MKAQKNPAKMNNYTNYLTILNTVGKRWLTPFWWVYLQRSLSEEGFMRGYQ